MDHKRVNIPVLTEEPQEPRVFHIKKAQWPPAEPRTIIVKVKTHEEPTQAPKVLHVITHKEDQKRSDFNRPFYTIEQAAEVLQVHENTVYKLVRSGKVEHYRVGAQIRIAAAELERLKVERKA